MPLTYRMARTGGVSLEKLNRILYKLSSLKRIQWKGLQLHINVELEFHDFCAVYV